MGKTVILSDPDRPDEPVEATIEQSTLTELGLLVAQTSARLRLHRPNAEAAFEGWVDGRKFIFDPSKWPFAALFEKRQTVDG